MFVSGGVGSLGFLGGFRCLLSVFPCSAFGAFSGIPSFFRDRSPWPSVTSSGRWRLLCSVTPMSDFTPPPPEVVAAETALSLAADDASRAWSAWEDAEAKLSLAEDALRAACEAAGYPPSAVDV